MERGRNFMREAPPGRPAVVAYYDLSREFFDTMDAALDAIVRS
jgi:hypothetical protein